ncbi:MAG: hypothetical protein Athens101426_576 [Parcubacteria group bacterium Athens1014_26]|nr:MAG: hypothetical protein Athens101426_576 [Parcubacteria group bacterium Athens1014_26]
MKIMIFSEDVLIEPDALAKLETAVNKQLEKAPAATTIQWFQTSTESRTSLTAIITIP